MDKKFPNLNGHKRTADLHKEAQMARNAEIATSKPRAPVVKKSVGKKIKDALRLK